MKTDEFLEALLNRIQGDLPYQARQAALEAVGKQRHAAPLNLLLATSQQEGYNGIVQSGALTGLASTRRDEAVEQLLEQAPYGATPVRARYAVVSGLGDVGQGQEKARREQIVEILSDLLRDPWWPVHISAARSLQLIKAAEAIPVLETYAKSLSYQDQVIVERMIGVMREADKLDGSAMKKQVEELQK